MNILVYVRNMPDSGPAVRYGGLMARLLNAKITLLASYHKNISSEDAASLVDEAAALLPDHTVEKKSIKGSAARAILSEIKTDGYDMVILTARRAIRYRQRFLQKLGRLIAIESPIPVLVIKDHEDPLDLKRILICSGGKDLAIPVIKQGAAIAKASDAELTLLHVTTPIPSMYTGMDEIEETLEELLQTDTPTARHLRVAVKILADEGLKAELEIRQGDVTEEILQAAEQGKFDMIVIGSSPGDNRLKEWLMGDVTRSIVNHAAAAVLVVR